VAEASHLDHDVERLVDYADGELRGDEQAAAERQIADCAECAQLVTDLRALAVAHRDAPILAARPRDFRLTEMEAARLRAGAPHEEPVLDDARLGIDMTIEHPQHDPLLIAAAADDRLEPVDHGRVTTWLATCSTCATLRDDLVAIATANRELWTPARVRDFRLTDAEAQRLRRRDWRGFLRWIGSSGDSVTRPLAAGLTTLGLVGLLVTSGSSIMPFASSSSGAMVLSTVGAPLGGAVAPEDAAASQSDRTVFTGQGEAPVAGGPSTAGGDTGAAIPAASAAASAAPAAAAAPSEAPPAPDQTGAAVMAAPTLEAPAASETDRSQLELASPTTNGATGEAAKTSTPEGPPVPVIVSIGLLLAGVGLFRLRRVAKTPDG